MVRCVCLRRILLLSNKITIFVFVGMTGFEPATTRSQSDHSTRLNYIPMNLFVIKFWRVYYSEDFGLFIILFTNKFCLFLVRVWGLEPHSID